MLFRYCSKSIRYHLYQIFGDNTISINSGSISVCGIINGTFFSINI